MLDAFTLFGNMSVILSVTQKCFRFKWKFRAVYCILNTIFMEISVNSQNLKLLNHEPEECLLTFKGNSIIIISTMFS